MSDLEITRLCAEAWGDKHWATYPNDELQWIEFDPLHDDAQAMALVKKMRIEIATFRDEWHAGKDMEWSYGPDLNRAICECVANMQAAKDRK